MTQRTKELHVTADGQIVEMINLISGLDDSTLRLPCPGREKLGDGTVAAAAWHSANNYQRIAAFIQTSDQMSSAHKAIQHGTHRTPRILQVLGHGAADHGEHGPGAAPPEHEYTANDVDLGAVVQQLSATRAALGRLVELTDSQLDAIPPQNSFRFCDGQRSLEEVLARLLKHQRHQVDALAAATA
jgi:hypothetical protein